MNLLLFHLLSIISPRIRLPAPLHTPCPTVPVKHARPRFKTSFAPAGLKEKRGPTNQCEQSRKTPAPRAWWILYACFFFLPPKCYHCFCVAWKLWSRTLEDVEQRLKGLVWSVTCGKDLSTEPGQVVCFSSVNCCGSNCWLRPTFKNQGTGFQFLLKSVKARKTLTQASS